MGLNVEQTKTAIKVLFNSGITPLIVGHHGIGKSQVVAQLAQEEGYGIIDIRVGQMADAGELIGLAEFLRDEDTGRIISTKFFQPHFLPTNGKWLLFCDEINRGSKEILQAIFQLVYDKKIGLNGYTLGKEMHVICAQNPATEDYDVLDFGDEAFNDRFCQIEFKPSVAEWVKYMRTKYDSFYIDYIQDNPKDLEFGDLAKFDLKVKPSRRSGEMLMKVEKTLEALKISDDNLYYELGAGLIGKINMSSYLTAKKNAIRNVNPLDIMDNFKEHKKYLKRITDNETGKPEIAARISTDLNEYLAKIESITDAQWDNVLDYYLLTTKEHLYAFFKPLIVSLSSTVYMKDNLEKFFNESKKCQKLITKLKTKSADLKKEESENEE
jgi:MoxR-like ATPase